MAIEYKCPECGLTLVVAAEVPDNSCPKCQIPMQSEVVEQEVVSAARPVINATLTSSTRIHASIRAAEKEVEEKHNKEEAKEVEAKKEEVEIPVAKVEEFNVDSISDLEELRKIAKEKNQDFEAMREAKREAQGIAHQWMKYAQDIEEHTKVLEEKIKKNDSEPKKEIEGTAPVATPVAIELDDAEIEKKKQETSAQMKKEAWKKMTQGTAMGMGVILLLALSVLRPDLKTNQTLLVLSIFVCLVDIVATVFFVQDLLGAVSKGKEAAEQIKARKMQAIANKKANKTVTSPSVTKNDAENKDAPKASSASAKNSAFAARAAAMKMNKK